MEKRNSMLRGGGGEAKRKSKKEMERKEQAG